jgi:hypothetical protein
VFENRVLRKIFRPKKDEVTGEWRRLHHEMLYDLYFPPNIPMVSVTKSGKLDLPCVTYWGKESFTQCFGW